MFNSTVSSFDTILANMLISTRMHLPAPVLVPALRVEHSDLYKTVYGKFDEFIEAATPHQKKEVIKSVRDALVEVYGEIRKRQNKSAKVAGVDDLIHTWTTAIVTYTNMFVLLL